MAMYLGIDIESYWSNEYSLSKMDVPSYVLDPRFFVHGCAFKENDSPSFFVPGPEVADQLKKYDPETTTTYAYNASFDNCILAWRYGFVPAQMICTMRLAVATCGHVLKAGASLASVAKHLKLGEKGTTLIQTKGLSYSELRSNPTLWREFTAYANHDNDLSYAIYRKLSPELSTHELRLMSKVLKCAVVPRFRIDTSMLRQHLDDVQREKDNLLLAIEPGGNLDEIEKTLRSNAKFEALLQHHGIEIQYKQSATNPEAQIPCFAKTDEFMNELLEHYDPQVQTIAAARLGVRSTIEQTRGEKLLHIAGLPWPNYLPGNMPVPLKYSGAHTHRLSGDWKINLQNLPAREQKSKLRASLIAPPGYKLVAADKSQIECRINAYICGQHDLLQQFRDRKDPYAMLASRIFAMPVDRTTLRGVLRFIGKTGVLGLGYGCGHEKFFAMVRSQARIFGVALDSLPNGWTPELAKRAVDTYRRYNTAITASWSRLDSALRGSWMGGGTAIKWGPVVIGPGYVEGPNGMRMHYARPRVEVRQNNLNDMVYDYGQRTHKIYGSKFLENIVQFLARINTMNDALRIADCTGHDFVLQSHDELVWIIPEEEAEDFQQVALREMRRPPFWARDLPLDAESHIGNNYMEMK
jgi:hypothetical protein